MKELFAPYELAARLKSLRFNAECLTAYNRHGELVHVFDIEPEQICSDDAFIWNTEIIESTGCVAAPLWQQVLDWLREEKKIHIFIWYDYAYCRWDLKLQLSNTENGVDVDSLCDSYYEALQSGIERALDILEKGEEG